MSEHVQFHAEQRVGTGKGAARAVRRNGKVPAIVYGNKELPQAVSVDARELSMQVRRGGFLSNVVNLNVDGKSIMVLPRDYQKHPVTDQIEHVDFIRVDASSKVNVFVPVVFLNEDTSPGIKRGGVLNIVRHEVEFTCSPLSIPNNIEVDLAEVEIGDSIHISSVKLPSDVTPVIANRDFTIATLASPTVDTPSAGEAGSEETEEDGDS